MTYFSLHRILALINIIILLPLIADCFLLPLTRVREIYESRSSVESQSSYRSHRYSTDYIQTISGDEFQVPTNWQNTNIGLNKGDTFYVDKSAMMGKAIALYFPWGGGFARMGMTALNNGYWGLLIALYILGVSLIQLLPWQLIKRDKLNERLIFFASALLIVLLSLLFF